MRQNDLLHYFEKSSNDNEQHIMVNTNGVTQRLTKIEIENSSEPTQKLIHMRADQEPITNESDAIEKVSENDKIVEGDEIRSRFPSAILLGAGKSGTGVLMHFLGLHPSVVVKPGEMSFFHTYYDRGLEWYRQQMPMSRPDQITIEKTAGYMFKSSVAERIYNFNSSIKLLMILTEPVVRSLSCYAHMLSDEKYKPYKPFEKTVLNEANGEVNQHSIPILSGRYSLFVKMWLDRFPKEQLHIVDGEIFKKDPVSELAKIEQFLGINKYFTQDMFRYDESKGFFCSVASDGQADCLGRGKGRHHEEISEELREKLTNFFEPFNKNLTELTGRQFSWT